MDTFRLIRNALFFVVGLMLGGWSVLSHAETQAATSGSWPATEHYYTVYGYAGPDPNAACVAIAASGVFGSSGDFKNMSWMSDDAGSPYKTHCKGTYQTETAVREMGTFTYKKWCPNDGNYRLMTETLNCSGYVCPAGQNWTLSGTTCTRPDCVAPQVRDPATGICGAAPCEVGATSSASRYTGVFSSGTFGKTYGTHTPTPSTLCNGSCLGEIVSVNSCNSSDAAGTPIQCQYTIALNGSSCSGGNGAAPAGDPCIGQGQIAGTLNGVPICSGTAPTNTDSKTTTTSPAGNSTTNNTTTTTCTGAGSCTTTTTTTTTSGGSGPGGTGPGSTTTAPTETKKDLPKSAFCEENPNSSICKNSSFAGTCDAPPACDGDAVQCAQAKAAFELKCLAEKDDDLQIYARGVLSGSDPKAGEMPNPNNAEVVPLGTLDTSEIFSGGCPSNPTMTAFGHTYTFSLAPLCELGGVLGQLNVMLALIAAVWLVGGSVKGS